MKTNIPAEVQAAKLAKKHAKKKSRRNAKNGIVNHFKAQILEQIYQVKDSNVLRGAGFVTADGRAYFQEAYVAEVNYFDADGAPVEDPENTEDLQKVETVVKKTIVRLD